MDLKSISLSTELFVVGSDHNIQIQHPYNIYIDINKKVTILYPSGQIYSNDDGSTISTIGCKTFETLAEAEEYAIKEINKQLTYLHSNLKTVERTYEATIAELEAVIKKLKERKYQIRPVETHTDIGD